VVGLDRRRRGRAGYRDHLEISVAAQRAEHNGDGRIAALMVV
jgi:hypothetical protein